MHISSSAVVLTVDDVAASVSFLATHLGFRTALEAPGFASLQKGPSSVVFMQKGSEILPAGLRAQEARGVVVALTVSHLEAEETRLRAAGVPFTLPLTEQPWGERLFMIQDPNGLTYELLEWARPQEGSTPDFIEVRGARVNNLRDISVDIPKRRLTVFTGVSGSGKSSLVFDTIAAESQRLINETFSTFVQNFLPKLGRPEVENLRNLSAAIVVGQERMGGNARSTLGTATDAYALLRLLFSRLGKPAVAGAAALSFNNPEGMCPACQGLGRTSQIDVDRVVDRNLSLDEGALLFPTFNVGGWFWSIFAKSGFFDPAKKLRDYTKKEWQQLLYAEECKVKTGNFNSTYEGLILKLRRLYLSKDVESLQAHLRAAVERAVTFGPCEDCQGTRLNAAARACRMDGRTIAECSAMQLGDLAEFVRNQKDPAVAPVVKTLAASLDDFVHIGLGYLGYLSLDREASTLSGGEAQRVKIVRHLGSSLTDMTYVFDEPTVGLHAHDMQRMGDILLRLRDKGNTVLVVEHKQAVISLADHVVDMGPGPGRDGGRITYQGDVAGLLRSDTETGRHLGKAQKLKESVRAPQGRLEVKNATLHNLKNVSVKLPRGVLTAVTGVAGSGKSALIRGCLPEQHPDVVVLDQRITGGSRRSNTATYTGVLDPIRKAFAKANGVDAALFSANSKGACPDCKGIGLIYTDLAFMEGVASVCETCGGKRFTPEVLGHKLRGRSIDEVLAMPVRDAASFFTEKAIRTMLNALVDVGLGYITLGQPVGTMSGGERQRLELGMDLGNAAEGQDVYILDEPTTGLHMKDVQHLIGLMDRLVDSGRTLIVIEHNLDVVARADWVVDLGPGAGRDGGRVIFEGPPAVLARQDTLTGQHLRRHVGG
jgi:excinuclease UvrABC ATPase subunit/catechol 2,3-dioxygenase-like lactoylglutathione lyase family enzyme